MDYYKVINRELIGELQQIKIYLAAFKKEVVDLQSQLMESHRIRLEQKTTIINLLTNNFMNTVKNLDPQIDIVDLVKGNTETSVTQPNLHTNIDGSETPRGKRSSLFFRSSTSSLSPIYRRSNYTTLCTKDSENYSQCDMDLSYPNDNQETSNTEDALNHNGIKSLTMITSIIEEPESEDDECETSQSIVFSKSSPVLRDVTNLVSLGATHSPHITHIRGKRINLKTKAVPAMPNFDNHSDSKMYYEKTVNNEDKAEIKNSKVHNKDLCDDLTKMVMNDLIIEGFKEVASSTPRNSTLPSDISEQIMRPRRANTNKNYTESSLKLKLRNNNKTNRKKAKKK